MNRRTASKIGTASSLAAGAAFAALLGIAFAVGRIHGAVFGIYAAASLAAFAAYGADKAAAIHKKRRIPENALHLLALAGGWPGAIAARNLFRHKTSKMPFRAVFWLTVILNCAAFLGLLFLTGSRR